MGDVFEGPRSGVELARSKSWVSNTIDFIIRSKGSLSGMMGIISYDYLHLYTLSKCVGIGTVICKILRFRWR